MGLNSSSGMLELMLFKCIYKADGMLKFVLYTHRTWSIWRNL